MDEARLASPEVGQPQHVDAGRVDDTAVVPEVAPSVEHGQVEPRVVGPETRRPDDGAHVAAELDPEPRRGTDLRGLVALRRVDLRADARLLRPLVEQREQPVHLEVRQRADVAERARELCPAVADAREATHELHALRAQHVKVERLALRRADQLRRRHAPRAPDRPTPRCAGRARRKPASTTARRGPDRRAACARARRRPASRAGRWLESPAQAAGQSPTRRPRAPRPRRLGQDCGSSAPSPGQRCSAQGSTATTSRTVM